MPRNAECWVRLTTGHWVENKSVQSDQSVQSVQSVPRCVAKPATLLLQATLSCCAANYLATGHWVENIPVQSDQPVPRCNGKAVTLYRMRLATMTAERFRGAPRRTENRERRTIPMVAGSPAQRDQVPVPPTGRGTRRQMRPFLAFSLPPVAVFSARFWRTWEPGNCLTFGGHSIPPYPALSRHIPRLRQIYFAISLAGSSPVRGAPPGN